MESKAAHFSSGQGLRCVARTEWLGLQQVRRRGPGVWWPGTDGRPVSNSRKWGQGSGALLMSSGFCPSFCQSVPLCVLPGTNVDSYIYLHPW